ncbi:unnamed protein product [Rotaria magnacalcarata]|uniref:Choline/carnitine acyltransferase domain-containing protein n=2 Tax=Rotaria magnacalcarata TaxID=392030 RepID=A0A816DE21_9BILA|nr:unnamed protein product [Rotaria magnacalcarata]CAF1636085.1 unnamed protein product [Rotaria magnacalcarata]CAF2147938.1 unnamed protein product [Rotaria magnacalcarata]
MSLAVRRTCATLFINRNVSFDLYQRQHFASFHSVPFRRPPITTLRSMVRTTSTCSAQQSNLPRLPVPTLADTARKYLKAVAPLLNNDEFNETKKIVEEFQHESKPLQELLLKRADTEENWLSQWWLDKVYLEWRSNLPIFYNPALLLPRQSYRDFDGQIQFAAHVIQGILQYRSLIDNNQIPVDRFGSDPLCMDQYRKVLGICRIPAKSIDRLHLYNKTGHRHVAIFHRNNIYRLPVYDDQGNKLSAADIYSSLKKLADSKESDEKQTLIGHLTADERQLWAPIHEQLSSVPENKNFLDTINDSLFVLCLDENYQSSSGTAIKKDTQTLMGFNFLHGGGTKYNTANRWFDKTLQVIVAPDGYSGVNYEHSLAEGGIITALVDYVLDHCKTAQPLVSTGKSSLLNKCQVVIPKDVEQSISESEKRVNKFIENCDLTVHKYPEFGKEFAKQNKLSIDGMIQVALQVAYFRMHGKCGATYESGSLRRYHLGRTETIRSCTLEAQQFARAMTEQHNETGSHTKYELFLKAMQAQRQYTTDAINAKGIDRHLLGLRLIAAENNLPKPALYNHISYKRAMHYILSTSQVGAKHDCVMIYGPAVDDGYGCCYNPRNDSINYMVTTFKINNEGTNAIEFSNHFNSSLTDMRSLIEVNTAKTMKAKL